MLQIKGKIPIRISGFFFVTAALIGFLNSRTLAGTLIWVGIIFVSILVHEFGHAFSALAFGQKPRIELVAFGGLTYPEGKKLSLFKEFVVVFMGPFFGFLLFVLATLIVPVVPLKIVPIVQAFRFVNLFWTIVNLLPVLPLDGGQLLRIVLEAIFGAKGVKYATLAGLVLAALGALTFFMFQSFIIGALFALFAMQNFEMYRRIRAYSEPDRSSENQKVLQEAETLMLNGQSDAAEKLLESLLVKVKKGVIFITASEHLARIKKRSGDISSIYDLLVPIEKHLKGEARVLLHEAAFLREDYSLVCKLSGVSFQVDPSQAVALRNAEAAAYLKDISSAIGWLKAAKKIGPLNVKELFKKGAFSTIELDSEVQKFLSSL